MSRIAELEQRLLAATATVRSIEAELISHPHDGKIHQALLRAQVEQRAVSTAVEDCRHEAAGLRLTLEMTRRNLTVAKQTATTRAGIGGSAAEMSGAQGGVSLRESEVREVEARIVALVGLTEARQFFGVEGNHD
jgi:hypothetical protein